VQEVQKVYRSQGVDINVKHVEMIIRQMLKKVKVVDPGDTTFFTDQIVSKHELLLQNRKVRAQGAGLPPSISCSRASRSLRWKRTASCLQRPSRRRRVFWQMLRSREGLTA